MSQFLNEYIIPNDKNNAVACSSYFTHFSILINPLILSNSTGLKHGINNLMNTSFNGDNQYQYILYTHWLL